MDDTDISESSFADSVPEAEPSVEIPDDAPSDPEPELPAEAAPDPVMEEAPVEIPPDPEPELPAEAVPDPVMEEAPVEIPPDPEPELPAEVAPDPVMEEAPVEIPPDPEPEALPEISAEPEEESQQTDDLDKEKVPKPINSGFAGKNYSLDDAAAKKIEKSDFLQIEDNKVNLDADELLKVLKSQDIAEKYPEGVPFDNTGHPDFSGYAYKNPETGEPVIIEIEMQGNHSSDYKKANEAAGLDEIPEGYTWHHHQDRKTMILVPTDLHGAVRHSGGVSAIKHQNEKQRMEI